MVPAAESSVWLPDGLATKGSALPPPPCPSVGSSALPPRPCPSLGSGPLSHTPRCPCLGISSPSQEGVRGTRAGHVGWSPSPGMRWEK